jgi:hypothetical protein
LLVAHCPSPELRHFRTVRNGGSGASKFKVKRPAAGATSVDFRLSDVPGPREWQRGCWSGDEQVNLAGQQVLETGSRTAIWYDGELSPRLFPKQCCEEVVRDSGPSGRGLVRIGLEPSDQFDQVVGRQRFPCKKHLWICDQRRNGREIVQNIIGKRIVGAVEHMRPEEAPADRIAVGPRTRDPTGAHACE